MLIRVKVDLDQPKTLYETDSGQIREVRNRIPLPKRKRLSKEVNVCAGGNKIPHIVRSLPVQFPLYDDAKQPISLTCSTALQSRGRRTESCRRLKLILKRSTFSATLLALLLTASSLWPSRTGEIDG